MWVYTGHSDGMYLKKGSIKILRIEDFCEIIDSVTGNADLIVFDCCSCGNINCLSVCYNYTDYVIASASYQSYMSFLHTKELYSINNPKSGKMLINSLTRLEQMKPTKSFPSAFTLYHLNETFLIFIDLFGYYQTYLFCNF